MTGPQHYRDAEACIERAASADNHGRQDNAAFWHRKAQIHATLALVAATAANIRRNGAIHEGSVDPGEWTDVLAAKEAS